MQRFVYPRHQFHQTIHIADSTKNYSIMVKEVKVHVDKEEFEEQNVYTPEEETQLHNMKGGVENIGVEAIRS